MRGLSALKTPVLFVHPNASSRNAATKASLWSDSRPAWQDVCSARHDDGQPLRLQALSRWQKLCGRQVWRTAGAAWSPRALYLSDCSPTAQPMRYNGRPRTMGGQESRGGFYFSDIVVATRAFAHLAQARAAEIEGKPAPPPLQFQVEGTTSEDGPTWDVCGEARTHLPNRGH
jgi:hypothetical protein